MTLKDKINRVRNLSNQSQQLIEVKKKVAQDFDRGLLTHQRLDRYLKQREKILAEVRQHVKT